MSARPGRIGGLAIPLGLFLLVGIALWGWNAWRLLRGRATPAVVVASSVEASRGRGGTTYRPRVEYRYATDDGERTGTDVLPGRGEGRGQAWAEAIADRYHPGDSTIAYVDAARPDAAYLVRQPSAAMLLLVAAPLAILGLLAVGGGDPADPMPPPDPSPAGPGSWALALVADPRREAAAVGRAAGRWRLAALAALAAHVGLVIGCAAGEGSVARALAAAWRSTLGDGFFLVDAAALAGAWWWLGRRRRATAATADRVRGARVLLDRAPLRAGSAVDAALHLSLAGADTALRDARLRLEREIREAPGGKSRRRDEHAPLEAGGGAAPDATHPATFVVPDGASPSTVRPEEPLRETWAFVARLRFVDGHETALRFPVRVHGRD